MHEQHHGNEDQQRKHDLLMRAFNVGVPEDEVSDDLDVLEATVIQYESQVKDRNDTAYKGATESDPQMTRQQLLMEAFRLGVELSLEESEELSAEELQSRIDDKRNEQN